MRNRRPLRLRQGGIRTRPTLPHTIHKLVRRLPSTPLRWGSAFCKRRDANVQNRTPQRRHLQPVRRGSLPLRTRASRTSAGCTSAASGGYACGLRPSWLCIRRSTSSTSGAGLRVHPAHVDLSVGALPRFARPREGNLPFHRVGQADRSSHTCTIFVDLSIAREISLGGYGL